MYVTKKYSDAPRLPVITLDTSAGSTVEHVYRLGASDNEVYYKRHYNININLWCNTEDEREDLTKQIMNCFMREQLGHYTYCSKYNEGICHSTQDTCDALPLSTSGRSSQCPHPRQRKYESLTTKHCIIDGTVNVNNPFNMDEINETGILLRSVFRAECTTIEQAFHDEPSEVTRVDVDDVTVI